MAMQRSLGDIIGKLGVVSDLVEQMTALVKQLTTLTEQQDRIEAKLDQLLELAPIVKLMVTPDSNTTKPAAKETKK